MHKMNCSSANMISLQSSCLKEMHKCTCGRMTVFPEIASIAVLIHSIIFSVSVTLFNTFRTEKCARKVIWAYSWYHRRGLWCQIEILLNTDTSVQCLQLFNNVFLMKRIQRRSVRFFRSLESFTLKENLKGLVRRLKLKLKKTGYFFSDEWQIKSFSMLAIYWTRTGLKFWKKRVMRHLLNQ